MKLKIITVVIAIVVIGLIGVQFNNSGFFALPEQGELEVGVSLALTGAAAQDNEKIFQGIEFAKEEINASGGINGKKIRLIVEDDKCDGKEGASIMNRFATTTQVPIVLGGSCSSVTFAMAPIARQNNVVLLSPYSSNPQLSNEGIFRTVASDVFEAGAMVDYAFEELGAREVAFLYVNNDYGKGLIDEFRQGFEAKGGTIVASETFNTNEKDFRTNLLKLDATGADAIYLVAYAGEFVPFFKQKEELGIEKQVLTIMLLDQQETLENVDKEADGTIFSSYVIEPEVKFAERFKARFGEKPDLWHAIGFDTMTAAAKAIEQGGYDADGIRQALHEVDFQGAANRIRFDKNGDPQYDIAIKQVKGGKFVVLE